jgi:hypothetical protein
MSRVPGSMSPITRFLVLAALGLSAVTMYVNPQFTFRPPASPFPTLLETAGASRPPSQTIAREVMSEIRRVPTMKSRDAHEKMLAWGFTKPASPSSPVVSMAAQEQQTERTSTPSSPSPAAMGTDAARLKEQMQNIQEKVTALQRQWQSDNESLMAIKQKKAALSRISKRHMQSASQTTLAERDQSTPPEHSRTDDTNNNGGYIHAIWGQTRKSHEVETPYLPPTGVRLRAATTDGYFPRVRSHDEDRDNVLSSPRTSSLAQAPRTDDVVNGTPKLHSADGNAQDWRSMARGVRVPRGIMGGISYLSQVFHESGVRS